MLASISVTPTLLDGVDAYLTARDDMAANLAEGFWSLAQAKYTMGPGKIGRGSYDFRMKASTTLEWDGDVPTIVFGRPIGAAAPAAERKEEASEELVTDEKVDELASTLRRRVGFEEKNRDTDEKNADGENVDGTTDNAKAMPTEGETAEQKKKKKKADAPLADPVSWFGILAPPHLRSAQASFKQALDRMVALTALTRELEGMAESE
ncbi:hypothetical protein HK101_006376 [Irineochytrium annulatum]|nr:hypothetical protein HK101_006376 [Irineochytrium annulatum]